jgi:hypothetical protein
VLRRDLAFAKISESGDYHPNCGIFRRDGARCHMAEFDDMWTRFHTATAPIREVIHLRRHLLAQQEVREAVEYVKESGFSEGELAAYEKYWDGVSVERTLLADAIAEGEAKGRAEGRAEGKLLGQQVAALKMLRKGLGVQEVADLLEIEAEELLRLSRLLAEFGPAAEEHCAR